MDAAALPLAGQAPERRPVHDLAGAVADFGRDGWAVLTAPTRMDEATTVALVGVLGGGAVLFGLDGEIQPAAADPDRSGLEKWVFDVGNALEPIGFQGNTNVWYAAAAVLGYATRQDWLQHPAKQILYAHWIGSLGRSAAGRLLGRLRPNQTGDPYRFEPGTGTSFPSGHAAVVFELAYILSHHVDRPPVTVVLHALAATVSWQRVASDSHWASDALLGAAWGHAVARVVVATEEERRLGFVPASAPGGGPGLALRLRFLRSPWES